MPLIVFVVNFEGLEQALWVAGETQSVFEPSVEVGVELDLVDHVGLVYNDVAWVALVIFS